MLFRASARHFLLALPALVLSLAACAASDPPPTSPLDEDPAGPTGGGTTVPLPTFTPDLGPTSPGSTPASDAAAEVERATGEAIARLAEWIGAPATEFRLTKIERVDWSDACLGVAFPGRACAEVITPGYLVELHHVDAPDIAYFVHASKAGNYAWAPTHGPEPRVIAALDPSAGTVTLQRRDDSEQTEETVAELSRVVPGSTLDTPLTELQPGGRVEIGTADGLGSGNDDIIVLLVALPD